MTADQDIAEINLKLARMDDEIESMLIRQNAAAEAMFGVQRFRSEIDDGLGKLQQLADTLSTSIMLAERVNYHVRTLDRMQRNAAEACKRVADLSDLKQCCDGLQTAVRQNDFVRAAEHASRFLAMDPSVFEDPNAARMGGLIEEAARSAEERLRSLRVSTPQTSVAAATTSTTSGAPPAEAPQRLDAVEFLKWFRILHLFGKKDLAARYYSQYLADALDIELTLSLPHDATAARDTSQQSQVVILLDIVAALVEQELPRLRSVFEPVDASIASSAAPARNSPLTVSVLRSLQKHADERMEPMLRRMIADLSALQVADVKEMDYWLDTMSQLLQKCELYDAFLKDLLDDTGLVTVLRRNLVEILGQYVRLSEMFIRTTAQTILSESAQEDIVDDVFFVLETAQSRAEATTNSNCLRTTVHCILTVLGDVLLPELVKRDANNELEQAMRFVTILRDHLSDRTLYDNYDEVAGNFKKVLHRILGKHAKDLFAEKIKPLFAPLEKMSYLLDERQLTLYEVEDPFVVPFSARLTKLLLEDEGLSRKYSENNVDLFIRFLVEHSARYYEKAIMAKKGINPLGALQLDKDIRNFSNFFSGLTRTSVRDRFQRLFQISALLNIDKLAEFRDFVGPKAGPLDARGVKDVLKLRGDFSEAAVEKLVL